jgi:hypothetical protein
MENWFWKKLWTCRKEFLHCLICRSDCWCVRVTRRLLSPRRVGLSLFPVLCLRFEKSNWKSSYSRKFSCWQFWAALWKAQLQPEVTRHAYPLHSLWHYGAGRLRVARCPVRRRFVGFLGSRPVPAHGMLPHTHTHTQWDSNPRCGRTMYTPHPFRPAWRECTTHTSTCTLVCWIVLLKIRWLTACPRIRRRAPVRGERTWERMQACRYSCKDSCSRHRMRVVSRTHWSRERRERGLPGTHVAGWGTRDELMKRERERAVTVGNRSS